MTIAWNTGYATCTHTPTDRTEEIERARRVLDLTRFNLPLLEKVRDYIRANPEEHDQEVWARRRPSCGTAMCFAGWAVHFAGHSLRWEPRAVGTEAELTIDGRQIAEVAENELGLTGAESDALFNAYSSLPDLDWLIERITNGAITAVDPEYTPVETARCSWDYIANERTWARELLAALDGTSGN